MTASFWYFEDAAKDRLVLRPPAAADDGPMPDDVVAVLECQQGWLTTEAVRTLRDALSGLLDEGWTATPALTQVALRVQQRTDRITSDLADRPRGMVPLSVHDDLRALTTCVNDLAVALSGGRR